MTDTTPEIDALVADRFAAMTPTERIAIVMQMNETARRIILASLPEELSSRDRKHCLRERLYGRGLADRAYPLP
jgi:hypothetical protein